MIIPNPNACTTEKKGSNGPKDTLMHLVHLERGGQFRWAGGCQSFRAGQKSCPMSDALSLGWPDDHRRSEEKNGHHIGTYLQYETMNGLVGD